MGGEFGEPGDQGTAAGDGDQKQQGSAEGGNRQAVLEGTDHDLGDQHGLRDDQAGTERAQADDRGQEEASGASVAEKARVDRFHVKQALRSRGVCFT
ncbi:hypothetical protein GCM10018783_48280 [Streptomyces griseosporeus]|nr:hypothetical protein GCM10018783_48280 [Streptomyces griseosporeus]